MTVSKLNVNKAVKKYKHNVALLRDKALPVHSMKAYRGSTCITPLILNLGSSLS
jgi:hypothetical protein